MTRNQTLTSGREMQLVESLRILDKAGGMSAACDAYPQLETDIRALGEVQSLLTDVATPRVSAASQAQSRQRLLSALVERPRKGSLLTALVNRTATGATVGGLLFAAAVGAVAANTRGFTRLDPISEVLAVVGLRDEGSSGEVAPVEPDPRPTETESASGSGVNEDVQEAIEDMEPGPERGIAVSEAACEAAHDPARLPEEAQAAQEMKGNASKDCAHPNADGTPGAGHNPGADVERGPGSNAEGAGSERQSGKPEDLPDNGPSEPPGRTTDPESGGGQNNAGGPPGKNKKP